MSRKPPAPWDLASAAAFLGLLHMEIVQERLEREYNLDLITTAPSVVYKRDQDSMERKSYIDNPSLLPDPQHRDRIEEPYVQIDMITPEEFVGALMELSQASARRFQRHEISWRRGARP